MPVRPVSSNTLSSDILFVLQELTVMARPAIPISQLESHLWEAANILRGPVDAADFKTYVFPLLFFKRISDVHDEEYAAALANRCCSGFLLALLVRLALICGD